MNSIIWALSAKNGELSISGVGLPVSPIAIWGPTTATTTTVHATTPSPSLPGQSVTLTARVSGRVAPNRGTVTFVGAPSGSCSDLTLTVLNDTTSQASCTVTFNKPGTQRITARYHGAALPGDFGHLPSNSVAFDHAVVLLGSTTQITTALPDPSLPGQPVAVDVSVSGVSTRPADGQVLVTASTGETCTDTTATAGSGTTALFGCSISFTTVGPRTLTASYSGSATHADSSSAGEPHGVVTTLSLSPPSLPGGVLGVPYSQSVSASGAGSSAPYSYAVTTGALPPGLGLNSANGAITGTPTATGNYSFAITATDSSAPTVGGPFDGRRSYTIEIARGNQAALTLTATPSRIAFGGTSSLSTTGGSGSGAVTYAVTAGGATCSVSGSTLTGTGVGSCTVTATKAGDAQYNPTTAQGTVVVQAASDLQVTKDDGAAYALPDSTVLYEILVANAGPLAVEGARLRDVLPAGLSDALWTCTPLQLASCPQMAGEGDIDQALSLPVNGVLRYLLSARVTAPLGSTLINTVTIEPPDGVIELEPADNSASDSNAVGTERVFDNGFEAAPNQIKVPILEG